MFLQNQSPPGGGEPPPPPPPPPPRPPGRGRGPNQGPPDLDELWRDFNRRLSGLFGGSGNHGGGSQRGRDFQPDMKSAGLGFALLAVVALLVWLASGAFIVEVGQQAVVTRFGSYQTTVGAGFNWRLPYPIERHETVDFSQIRSVDVGSDDLVRSTGLRDSAMLTKDENIVEIKFAVQYRLNDARAYLFNSKDPRGAVVQAAESAVREVVGQMTMDGAMADERDQIAPRVRDLMQTVLDRYQVGIEVMAVNLQQSGVSPPEQVKPAFDDVLKAGQEREGAKNEAQAYANDVVPRATGEAARRAQDAEGYKASVVAQAQGDAERFSSVLAEYQKAPKVTRDRLYLDAMRQVYGGANKIVVDGKAGAGNLLVLPLDKIAQAAGAPQPAAAEAAPAAPAPAADASNARGRDNERSREREPR